MKMRFFQESSIFVSIRPLMTEEATFVKVFPDDGGISVRMERRQSRVPNTMMSSLLIIGIDALEHADTRMKIGSLSAYYRPNAVVVVQQEPRIDVPRFYGAEFDLSHFRQMEMGDGDGCAYLSHSLKSPIRHWEMLSYAEYAYAEVEMCLGHVVEKPQNLDSE